ncbi:MAG: hypothetical protein HOE90_19500 [Bacteriovoracaceae bacterium]|jgi:PPM family protein phosphatase|nr:hypothetical protein [Bacteriovoracaceae bacterium]
MIKIKSYAAETNSGPYLNINEDGYLIDLANKLFVIFDGFGGSGIGDKVVEVLKGDIAHFYTKFGGDPDSTMPFYFSHKYLLEGNALINSLRFSHKNLLKKNSNIAPNQRGGASAIAMSFSENICTLAGTGNCKAYLIRKGRLKCLVDDDSIRWVVGDDYHKENLTCPMSGFGLFEDLHLKVTEVKPVQDDVLLFLTDGTYARLEEEELLYFALKSDLTPSERIGKLFSLANERGNHDNQSGLLMQF